MKNTWTKYITRRLAVQIAQAWNFGWGRAMQKAYGLSVKSTLVFRYRQKTEYYVKKTELTKYFISLEKLLRKRSFVRNFNSQAKKDLEKILHVIENKFKKGLIKLNNNQLADLYNKIVLPNLENFYVRMWTVFNLNAPLSDFLERELEKRLKDKNITLKYLLTLSSQLKPNDVINERLDLLKIAKAQPLLTPNQIADKIRLHTIKYRHIPMFDFDHEPYNEKYFIKQLFNIKNPSKELKNYKKLFAGNNRRFKAMLNLLKPESRFRELIYFLKDNVYLRDYRDMIRQKLNLELGKLYRIIGLRLGLDIQEVATLTNHEILKYLRSGSLFPKKEVEARKKAFLLIQIGNKIAIYSGKKALQKAKKELKPDLVTKTREIKGVIGAVGIARGAVKIIYTNKDLYKIKKDDIMITSMTRQDFVPAMRLAAAVVTDEGGVICHAAIIARELKKPCVIGTKIATKVFKDGDMVEVDASKGTVRII